MIWNFVEKKSNYIVTRSATAEHRGRSPMVTKRGGGDSTNSTKIKRSDSVDNLQRQRNPNRGLMKPILQQNLTVFDGKFIFISFH
jgi:hypothetical protein